MASATQCNELTTHFVKLYTKKYGEKPSVNRNSARWGWDNILLDISFKEAKELIDYYFSYSPAGGHSVNYILYNYDSMIEEKSVSGQRVEYLRNLKQESKDRAERYIEERNKRKGIS